MKLKAAIFGTALFGFFHLALHGVSFAQAVPKLKQGMPYGQARNILLDAGWQAVFNREQINNPNRGSIVDYFLNKKEYTEIQDCAGTGLGLCLFKFENALGQTLYVSTANNSSNQESTVFRWWVEKACDSQSSN